MSTDPKLILEKLQSRALGGPNTVLSDIEARWVLAQFEHQDDQIEALRKLVKPPKPAPAAEPPRAAESICQEADRIVSHDRQQAYGHPRDDFSRTAAMWEPILGLPPGAISPEKVPMCMIAVKLSRLCNKYRHDTVVDIAGYAKVISIICEDPVG